MPDRTIEALLLEDRTFVPPPAFGQTATMRDERVYDEAAKDLEGFWARAAGDLHWFAKWRAVLEWAPPYAKWFVGGPTKNPSNSPCPRGQGRRPPQRASIFDSASRPVTTS